MNESEIFAAVGVDNHRRFQRWRFVGLPDKKILSISLERYFNQHENTAPGAGRQVVRGRESSSRAARGMTVSFQELPHSQKLITAPADQLVGLVAPQVFQLSHERVVNSLRRCL